MTGRFYYVTLITYLLLNSSLFGQSIEIDTVYVDSLLNVMEEVNRSNPDLAKEYGEKALSLIKGIDDKREARALYLLSIPYALGNEKAKSIKLAEEGLKIARKNGFKLIEIDLLYSLGIGNFHFGNYNRSIALFHQALPICDELNAHRRKAKALNGISIAYIENGDMDQAIPYIEQVYDIGKEFNLEIVQSLAKGNMSYALIYKQEYEQALIHLNEYFEISKNLNDSINTVVGFDMLAQIKNGLGDTAAALNACEETLKLAEALGYKDGEILGYRTRAETYLSRREYDKAVINAEKGLAIIEEIGAKRFQLDLYESLIEANTKNGNLKEANNRYKQLVDIKEGMFNVEKQKIRESLEIEYQIKKKDEENQILLTTQKRNETIIYQRTLLLISAFLLTFFIIAFSYFLNKSLQQKKKHNETLEKSIKERTSALKASNDALKNSNNELERFAFVASHDLKEPIRNIVSYSTLMQRSIDSNDVSSINELSKLIIGNSKNLYSLVDGILNFSRIRKIKINIQAHDITSIIKEAMTLIASKIKEENVDIKIDIENPMIDCDDNQTLLVVKNLIENAIKYNSSHGKMLNIHQTETKKYKLIHFEDNGIGINPKYHDQIFEMFQRLHSKSVYEGTGLGLSICKRIMNLHQGYIEVKSKEGNGSTFTIAFPIES